MKVINNLKSLLTPSILLQSILANRTYLMGWAMICVLIYHAFCWIYNPIGHLNVGYIGVDVFLFLSGLGLAFSFEKNDVGTFYKNRFWRIYPLYIIAVSITYALCYAKWDFTTYLANLTTIGYYMDGGKNRFDWYVNALISLYITFPLFYYYSKLRYVGLAILTILVFLWGVLYYHTVPYWYDCLISRLPIFLYGIMFSKCYKSSNIVALVGILLFIPCRVFSSKSLATSFLVIPLIIFLLDLVPQLSSKIRKTIEFCGKYSLEIYLANEMIPRAYAIIKPNLGFKILLYVVIEIVFAYIFIMISKNIVKWHMCLGNKIRNNVLS